MANKSRDYKFELPAKISGFMLMGMVFKLQGAGLWGELPDDMQARISQANDTFGGELVITKEDLDRLPDETWEKLASETGLEYEYTN